MTWNTSKKGNQTLAQGGFRCTVFENGTGYCFSIGIIGSDDKPQYSRAYRSEEDAKEGAEIAMADPSTFHEQFRWMLSKNDNFFVKVGETFCTVFLTKDRKYGYVYDGSFSHDKYRTEDAAMIAAQEKLGS